MYLVVRFVSGSVPSQKFQNGCVISVYLYKMTPSHLLTVY